jgi:DNA-directed RNA polymerase specialized sigma24 family protein
VELSGSSDDGRRLVRDALTATGFEKLLGLLDPDSARAGAKYELLRRKLVRFFEWHGAVAAEDRSDEVFDRVGRRLEEGEVVRSADPASYFYGVARNVLYEHLAERRREGGALPDSLAAPEPVPDSRYARTRSDEAHECLRRCLETVAPERRRLILGYYQGEKGLKIRRRQTLADELGIPLNALRLRALRIRESLERCVRACLETTGAPRLGPRGRREGRGRGERNGSGRFPIRSVERRAP